MAEVKYEMAPMEGITGYQFRETYRDYYGDADRYFTPFLVGKKLSAREKAEVEPAHNQGMELIPQILSNQAEEFVYIANRLWEYYGYEEVNLNLGCPSGTVASKNRGSGFLRVPDELDRFLAYIYTHSKTKISLKTRIGVIDAEGWDHLMDLYLQYPMSELIIHPRTQRQGYGGVPDEEAFALAVDKIQAHEVGVPQESRLRLCYNGNINSPEDAERIREKFPRIDAIMCGRGLIANPELLGRIRGTRGPELDRKRFREYTEAMYRKYTTSGNFNERNLLFRIKELWLYWSTNFPEPQKVLRGIQKATTALEYEAAVNVAFRSLEKNQ